MGRAARPLAQLASRPSTRAGRRAAVQRWRDCSRTLLLSCVWIGACCAAWLFRRWSQQPHDRQQAQARAAASWPNKAAATFIDNTTPPSRCPHHTPLLCASRQGRRTTGRDESTSAPSRCTYWASCTSTTYRRIWAWATSGAACCVLSRCTANCASSSAGCGPSSMDWTRWWSTCRGCASLPRRRTSRLCEDKHVATYFWKARRWQTARQHEVGGITDDSRISIAQLLVGSEQGAGDEEGWIRRDHDRDGERVEVSGL